MTFFLNFCFSQNANKAGKKRKRGAASSAAVAEEESEEEIVSNDELEYDDNVEVSEDSGSAFEDSDDEDDPDFEDIPVRKTRKSDFKNTIAISEDIDIEMDEEVDDEIMLKAAIMLSKEEAAQQAGAGPSSESARTNAAIHAAAAEQRIEKAAAVAENDTYQPDLADDLPAAMSSEDEVVSKGKGKGKGKAAPKKKIVVHPEHWSVRSFSDIRRERLDRAAQRRRERKENRSEEEKLMRLLGRKLTHVCIVGLLSKC